MRPNRGALAVLAVGGFLLSGCGLLGGSSVSSDEVEESISEELAQFGIERDSVSCPEDLDADVDATLRCTISTPDGEDVGVTVTVTEVDGRDVLFSIEVDDEPSS